LFAIVIGSPYYQPIRRRSGSIGCVAVSSCTRVAIWHAAPTVIAETSSITVSTLTNVRSPMLMAPYSQIEGRTHDDVLADMPQRLSKQRITLVLRSRRRPVEPGQGPACELGLAVGIVGDVQLAGQHPLSHLAHPYCLARRRALFALGSSVSLRGGSSGAVKPYRAVALDDLRASRGFAIRPRAELLLWKRSDAGAPEFVEKENSRTSRSLLVPSERDGGTGTDFRFTLASRRVTRARASAGVRPSGRAA
jgi:hypothetical protein